MKGLGLKRQVERYRGKGGSFLLIQGRWSVLGYFRGSTKGSRSVSLQVVLGFSRGVFWGFVRTYQWFQCVEHSGLNFNNTALECVDSFRRI